MSAFAGSRRINGNRAFYRAADLRFRRRSDRSVLPRPFLFPIDQRINAVINLRSPDALAVSSAAAVKPAPADSGAAHAPASRAEHSNLQIAQINRRVASCAMSVCPRGRDFDRQDGMSRQFSEIIRRPVRVARCATRPSGGGRIEAPPAGLPAEAAPVNCCLQTAYGGSGTGDTPPAPPGRLHAPIRHRARPHPPGGPDPRAGGS